MGAGLSDASSACEISAAVDDEDKFDEVQVDWLNYSGWPRSMATATRELFYNYICKTPTYNHSRIESGSSSSYIPKPFGETAFSDLVDESALEAKLNSKLSMLKADQKSDHTSTK